MNGTVRHLTAALALAAVMVSGGLANSSGAAAQPDNGPSPRVVNGEQGSMAEWPFLVALAKKSTFETQGFLIAQFCGGTLVSDTLVVTAAHCVRGRKPADLVVGSPGPSGALSGLTLQVRDVTGIEIYPDYDPRSFAGDIAVITLDLPLAGIPTLSPATPDEAKTLAAARATVRVAGWGATNKTEPWKFPDVFRTGDLTAFPKSSCGGGKDFVIDGITFSGYGPSDVDPAAMLCADGVRNGRPVDACVGDSGGPLVGGTGDGRRLVGIVSWGLEVCGSPRGPGIYTRVSTYADFLADAGVPFDTDPVDRPEPPQLLRVNTTPTSVTAVVRGSSEGPQPDTYAVTAQAPDGSISECTVPAPALPQRARCTIEGLVTGSTYVVTARSLVGTAASEPSEPTEVLVDGVPARPRIQEYAAQTGGTATFRVINLRGNGAPLLSKTVECTATGRPTRNAAIGAGGRATVERLRRGTEYSCVAIVTNEYAENRSKPVSLVAR